MGTPIALTAPQIFAILEKRPEIVVELKSLVSDQLQQQGSQIQEDDITDEMLYRQIATNAALRANITTFLRARGYVSDDMLQTLAQNYDDENRGGELGSAQSSMPLSGSELGGEMAGATAAHVGISFAGLWERACAGPHAAFAQSQRGGRG